MSQTLKQQLLSAFQGIQIDTPKENQLVIVAPKESILSVLSSLKNHGYNHLSLISCVDWIEKKAFELVYILSAFMKVDCQYADREKMSIIVKTKIPRDRSEFLTVLPVFENAEPYEREIHEGFNINFKGNVYQHSRLFLPENWPKDKFPMHKGGSLA